MKFDPPTFYFSQSHTLFDIYRSAAMLPQSNQRRDIYEEAKPRVLAKKTVCCNFFFRRVMLFSVMALPFT